MMLTKLKVTTRQPSFWPNVIGWFQLIVTLIILYVLTRKLNELHLAKDDGTYWNGRMLDHKAKKSVIVFGIIDVIQTFLTAFFAIVLLVGVYKRNANHLIVWLDFNVLLNFFYIISIIVEGIELGFHHGVGLAQCVAVILFRGLCITVVFKYKEILQDESRIKLVYAAD